MFDKRTPGLLKVERRGDGFVGLCSKTYYCFGLNDKFSTKGLSKHHNVINKESFLTVLAKQRNGRGVNRGFRVYNSSVLTYIQERASLTYLICFSTFTESAKYSPTVSIRRRWKYTKEEVEATTVQSSLWIHVGSILSLVSLPDLRVVEKQLSLHAYYGMHPPCSSQHPNTSRGITVNGSQRTRISTYQTDV